VRRDVRRTHDELLIGPGSLERVLADRQPSLVIVGFVSGALALYSTWLMTWHRLHLDLSVYLLGAHHLIDGRLYHEPLSVTPHFPFTYPPFAALFFWPLAQLPAVATPLVWAVVNIGALLCLIALSLWVVRPRIDAKSLWLFALVLLGPVFWFEPIWLNFAFGQINIVLDLLVFADLMVNMKLGHRTLPRGILVGLAAAVKLIPLIFVLYLFISRQTRAAITAVASFIACSMLAALVNPRVSWTFWTKYVVDAQRVGRIFYASNQSFRGAVDRLDHTVVSVGLVTAICSVILVAGLWLARWAQLRSSTTLAVLVTATTGMLASPVTWSHHLVWLIPILAWLILAPDRPRGGPLWGVGAAIVLWIGPTRFPSTHRTAELNEHGIALIEANAFFFLMLLFMIGVAVMLTVRELNVRSKLL
jgi:alpha-1,2-mannosyltransferase